MTCVTCDGQVPAALEEFGALAGASNSSSEQEAAVLREELIEKAFQMDFGFESQVDFATYSTAELRQLVGSHVDTCQTIPLEHAGAGYSQ